MFYHFTNAQNRSRFSKNVVSTVTLDGEFDRDLEEIICRHHEPLNPPAWDFSS